MKKIIVVENCKECPFVKKPWTERPHERYYVLPHCSKKHRSIRVDWKKEIPDFCPLPNHTLMKTTPTTKAEFDDAPQE